MLAPAGTACLTYSIGTTIYDANNKKLNMSLYFKIMVSSIYTSKNNGFMSDIWKFTSNFYVATASTANLLTVYVLLNNHFFSKRLDFLALEILNNKGLNFLLNLALYGVIPIMVINYYLVYKGKKYNVLIKEFNESYNKKIFAIYFLISFFLPFFLVFLK